MKNILHTILILIVSFSAFSGTGGGGSGPSTPPPACSSAAPFCASSGIPFPNSTGVSSLGGGGIYGCLSTTPNPVWYHVQVSAAGTISITVSQTSGDIDFVLWGPFASPSAGCGALSANNIVDCSYSTAATEIIDVSNAPAGATYILLLTNYSNNSGSITFTQTNLGQPGAGSTDCSILCNMSGMTAVPGACVPSTGQFALTGQFSIQDPPTTGTLTVSSSCGTSVNIPGPWGNTISYSMPGLPANGASCTVTAAFSADANCTITMPYTAPAPCNTCTVTAGNNAAGNACPGASVGLTASTVAGATGYAWSGPNGYTSNVQNPTLTVPSTPGTYTYTVTVSQNGAPCTATTSVVVAGPVANAGVDQAVCAGTPVTLTGTGGTGTPMWNNGVVNGVAFTPSATNTYTVTVTGANGCTNTDNVVVTINPTSIINAGQDVSVCDGQTVTLTATGGTAYGWNNTVTNGVPFTPPLGVTTYTVVDQNPTGCSGSDQVVVTVNPNPVVNAGVDSVICEGASIVFNGTGANTYAWDNGVVNGVPYSPAGTLTYTVTGTSAQGCTGTDQVTVTITPTPDASFAPSATFGCIPSAISFLEQYPSGNTLQWVFGNGQTMTGAGPVNTVYNMVGCYDVTLISTTPNGCVGQSTMPAVVCISPNPVAAFTPIPGILNQIESFSNMNNESTGATSYSWNFGDNTPYSTQTSPGHLFPSEVAGTYSITLIARSQFGCVDTAIVNIEVQDELVYYIPNSFTPDDDEHNPVFKPVFTSGFDPMDYKLVIFNRWGEMVFESNDANYGWDGTFAGSPGVIQDGSYTWKIEFKTTRTDERKMLIGNVTLIR